MNRIFVLSLWMTCATASGTTINSPFDGEFVGAKTCATCHPQEYKAWQDSHHFKAMQVASAKTVLGDFSDIQIEFHNINNHLYIEAGKYLLNTIGPDNKAHTYEIKYTFGFKPLQQYLVETDNGHIQALNIAWDSRTKVDGGQRWIHLRPEEKIDPEHIFFWTRHFQNWNSRCADCHSTNVRKNYQPADNSYETRWSEINVACEACHGPAAAHLDMARRDKLTEENTGFTQDLGEHLSWSFAPGKNIAEANSSNRNELSNMCGRCHSLRTQIADHRQENSFHDAYRLQLLNSNFYFPDGQINEEVFVLGSFLQSKMHQAGVTCTNCHDAHSGNVKIEGNGLCSQCHLADYYDRASHHRHSPQSAGAACVNCHMPERTYMQVDDRRDHSFIIPRPDLTASIGAPNPCENCHAVQLSKDKNWATKHLSDWAADTRLKEMHWGTLNHRAGMGDILVTRNLTQAVADKNLASIVRASMLATLETIPSRVGIETAQKHLNDKNAMVRRAAVQVLSNLPIELRWQILSPYMNDENRTVRFAMAPLLAEYFLISSQQDKAKLSLLLKEYRASLKFSEDSPATQMSIASLETNMGSLSAANTAYKRALLIEPNYIPALLNYAEFLRATRPGNEVESLLEKAVRIAPDSGSAQHAFGLLLIRQQQYQAALPYLKAATTQEDASPRFSYVYAVALENQDFQQDAINTLMLATERWPNQYDLLLLLVNYLGDSGDTLKVYKYLSMLSAIAPASPEVRALIQKYRQ